MEKSICFDASSLLKPNPTGVELYSKIILPKLSEQLLNLGFVVIWCTPARIEKVDSRIKQEVIPLKKLWTQIYLLKRLNEIKPDLYFSPSNFPPLLYKGQTMSIVHDMAFYHNSNNFSFIQKLMLGYFGRKAVENSSCIVVPSKYTALDLEKYWGINKKKIEVVYHGFIESETLTEEVNTLEGLNYFLIVGRIENKKNLQVIVDLFKSSKNADKLVLAGSKGLGAEEILKSVDDKKVVYLGYISDAQKKWLYQNAKAVIVPGQFEGFGFPVLEAFQNGIIPICSNQGSLPEIAGNAALYPVDNSIKGWSDALHKLEEPSLRQTLLTNGKIRLKEYTWERTTSKMIEIIRQIIDINE